MRLTMPFCVLLGLAGCASSEQFERPGTWKLPPASQGANDANLRAMVVNPRDLIAGNDEPNSLGTEAVQPIDRLLTGRRRPLANVNASTVGSGGNGGGGNGGIGGGAGAQP